MTPSSNEIPASTTFSVHHAEADEVYLTGDFNRWSVPGLRMNRVRPGDWEATLPNAQPRGRIAYAALVSGRVTEVVVVSPGSKAGAVAPASVSPGAAEGPRFRERRAPTSAA